MDASTERRLLGLLGLGVRGRGAIVGVDRVREAARKGLLEVAVVAPDASRHSLDKVVPLLEARPGHYVTRLAVPPAADLALTGHPHLRGGEPVVLRGVTEVDVPDSGELVAAVVVSPGSPVPVPQQLVDLPVGPHPVHHRTVPCERFQRLLTGRYWHPRVEDGQRITQPVNEDHLSHGIPAQGARRPEHLGEGIDHLPAEGLQQLQRRLLHQRTLPVGRRSHATSCSTSASRSSDDTLMRPDTSMGRSRFRIEASRSEASFRSSSIWIIGSNLAMKSERT